MFVSFKGSVGVLFTSPTSLSHGSFSVQVTEGHFEVIECFKIIQKVVILLPMLMYTLGLSTYYLPFKLASNSKMSNLYLN